MEPLLKVERLTVSFRSYRGCVQAVRGLNFEVLPGEILGIVGESGCGKSVAMQALLGLLPKSLTSVSGRVNYLGNEVDLSNEKQVYDLRGKEIALILQDSGTGLNPSMKVGRQVGEALRQQGSLSRAEVYQSVMDVLTRVGITLPEERFHQYPHELSGGLRQRVMIAMALIAGPRLLIADEPTTALDVTLQAQILSLLKSLQEQEKRSLLLITHDLGVVAGLCQRVLVLYAGQVVEEGSVLDIFERPSHPYTQALLAALPKPRSHTVTALRPIGGSPPDLTAPPSGCAFWPRCAHAMRLCQQSAPVMELVGERHRSACWLPFADRVKLKRLQALEAVHE